MKRVRVVPTKAQSMVGSIGGVIFCFIGLFIVIPTFGVFGIFWTLIAVVITGVNVISLFSEKGIATSQIIIDDHGESKSDDNINQKLIKLNELYEQRLITKEEFDKKKSEYLDKI